MRRNTLEPRAYGLSRATFGGWIVIFQFTDEAMRSLGEERSEFRSKGRGVRVLDDGSAVSVEHADALLNAVQIKLPARTQLDRMCGWQEGTDARTR
jgi:hypothetical protein